VTFVFDAPDPASVPIRDAATVMLLRDGPTGIEVQMLRRNLASDFVGGAYVFPGGAVDPEDSGPEVESVARGRTDTSASELLGIESGGLAFWVAAIRESFEEAGLLLAVDDEEVVVDLHADPVVAERFVHHRRAVDSGELRLVDLCRAEGLRLAVDSMQYFSRWITPFGAPRRYDTRFFVAHAPTAQTPLHDDREVIASLWIGPDEALARHAAGEFELIFPTVRSLEALQRFERADDVVSHAASLDHVDAVLPTIREGPNGLRIVLPGDGEYDAFTSRKLADS
jgi:8-oxo-dGTP pyrophosphatase MutT (NUDIX family)